MKNFFYLNQYIVEHKECISMPIMWKDMNGQTTEYAKEFFHTLTRAVVYVLYIENPLQINKLVFSLSTYFTIKHMIQNENKNILLGFKIIQIRSVMRSYGNMNPKNVFVNKAWEI